MRVKVHGRSEPCYCLTAMAPPEGSAVDPETGEAAIAPFEEGQDYDSQQMLADPIRLDRAELNDIFATVHTILERCEEGWMSGSALSKALNNERPDLVTKAKEAHRYKQSKGWLRRILDKDPTITTVRVEGLGEPCFSLASVAPTLTNLFVVKEPRPENAESADGAGGFAQSSGGNDDEGKGPFKKVLTPDEVLEKLGVEDFTSLCNVAVECLEANRATPFFEGGKLSTLIRERAAPLADRAKAALGNKGWLKHVLQGEPRIARVEVGKGEPCWGLTASL